MSNPIELASRLIRFLAHDIWSITNEDVRGVYRWLMNIFKAVFLSVRFFTAHRLMERASALTYYTLLAMVPMFALLLGIGRVIGVQDMLRDAFAAEGQAHSEALKYIFEFADSYIIQANNGLIVGVGAVMLLYVIFALLGNVETVMNEIWQQKKKRNTLRQITDYLSLIILVPLFLIISSGAQIFLRTYLSNEFYLPELSGFLLQLLRWMPAVIIICMLTLIYVVIPNCKVKFRNAFAAALIAGALFLAFQNIYISGQIWVSKYSAVYGSFAAFPLLLLWLQASWIICLYGAELSYASQNIQNYNFENLEEELSLQDQDFLTLLLTGVVYHRFYTLAPPPTTVELSEELHLPARVTGQLVRQLSELDIIRPYQSNTHELTGWQPGRPTDTFTVSALFNALHTTGINRLKINYKKHFAQEWATVAAMYQAATEKGQGLLVRDISTDGFKPLTAEQVKGIQIKPNSKIKKK